MLLYGLLIIVLTFCLVYNKRIIICLLNKTLLKFKLKTKLKPGFGSDIRPKAATFTVTFPPLYFLFVAQFRRGLLQSNTWYRACFDLRKLSA